MNGVRRCAVLGRPVAHSLSPLIHTRAYEVLGIADRWRYGRHDVGVTELPGFVASCGPEWVGLSCTAPLKSAVLALGEASEVARRLDSGNTFLFDRDGVPRVENTDVSGLIGALGRSGVRRVRTALLLGNGATARSALYALASLGADEVLVLARSRERAEASLGALAAELGVRLDHDAWGEVPDAAADILVSTVSVPLPPGTAAGLVARVGVCFEATYNHYPTRLDLAARDAGVVHLTGIDLLVGQALDQIRLMTGRDCPPEPLLAAAHAALSGRPGTPA